MKGRHGHIQSRQEQSHQQRQVAQNPQAGGGDEIRPPVLGRGHEPAQIHRCQIAQGQAVYQKPHTPVQKRLGKTIRPLRVLQQRKGRGPGAGDIFLHGGRRDQAVHVDLRQALLHPFHQGWVRQAVDISQGHVGQAPLTDLRFVQPQGRCTQVPPQKAGIGADSLGKGVLWPLDRIFHLRRGGGALFTGLVLKGDGPAAEKHHGKAVDQLQGHGVQVLAGLGDGVVDRAVEGAVTEQVHGLGSGVLEQRLDHVFRDVAAGGQAVDGI